MSLKMLRKTSTVQRFKAPGFGVVGVGVRWDCLHTVLEAGKARKVCGKARPTGVGVQQWRWEPPLPACSQPDCPPTTWLPGSAPLL